MSVVPVSSSKRDVKSDSGSDQGGSDRTGTPPEESGALLALDNEPISKFPGCGNKHIKLGTFVMLFAHVASWIPLGVITGEFGGAWGLLISLPIIILFVGPIALALFGVWSESAGMLLPYLILLAISLVVFVTVVVVITLAMAGVFGSSSISLAGVLVVVWALVSFAFSVYFLFASTRCYRYIKRKYAQHLPRTGLNGKK